MFRYEAMTYETLDAIAVAAGTGKSSIRQNFTRHYVHYFEKYRPLPVKFMELGIDQGSSVKLWEKYFPYAELHFVDITAMNIKYNSTRSQYHFISPHNKDNKVNG